MAALFLSFPAILQSLEALSGLSASSYGAGDRQPGEGKGWFAHCGNTIAAPAVR
jgi:hypothetical protein